MIASVELQMQSNNNKTTANRERLLRPLITNAACNFHLVCDAYIKSLEFIACVHLHGRTQAECMNLSETRARARAETTAATKPSGIHEFRFRMWKFLRIVVAALYSPSYGSGVHWGARTAQVLKTGEREKFIETVAGGAGARVSRQAEQIRRTIQSNLRSE